MLWSYNSIKASTCVLFFSELMIFAPLTWYLPVPWDPGKRLSVPPSQSQILRVEGTLELCVLTCLVLASYTVLLGKQDQFNRWSLSYSYPRSYRHPARRKYLPRDYWGTRKNSDLLWLMVEVSVPLTCPVSACLGYSDPSSIGVVPFPLRSPGSHLTFQRVDNPFQKASPGIILTTLSKRWNQTDELGWITEMVSPLLWLPLLWPFISW